MSFERPERLLTEEEWGILSYAALDDASSLKILAGHCVRRNDMVTAEYYSKKANKIYEVLTRLEQEYYEAHPDEDPDRKEN